MRSRPVYGWLVGLLVCAGACDSDHYLVGGDLDARPGDSASSSGTGGSTTGAGAGGSSSTGGSGTNVPPATGAGGATGGSPGTSTGGSGTSTGGSLGTGGSAISGTGGYPANDAGIVPSYDFCVPTSSSGIPARTLSIATAAAADRLATFLLGRRADETILVRAATLRTNLDIGGLARQLIRENVSTVVPHVLGTWLDLDNVLSAEGDSQLDATLTPALRKSMLASSEAFLTDLLLSSTASLHDVLTAPQLYIDQQLAPIFGLSPPATNGFGIDTIDLGQRAGILTHPAALVGRPDPTRRGSWILSTFMCEAVPPPPLGIPATPIPQPGQTHRAAYEQVLVQPACQACHQLADPAGFALGHFDAIGRFQSLDNGQAIDASAKLSLPGSVNGPFPVNGAMELGETLATNCQVQRCVSDTLLQQALGGPLRQSEQSSSDEVAKAFSGAAFNLSELLVAITESTAFLAP